MNETDTDTELFNSKDRAIPGLRHDIDLIPVSEKGKSYLYFHDARGYATPNLALDKNVSAILSLLDGQKSVEDLSSYLGEGITSEQLLSFIRMLDEHRLLYSPHFRNHAQKVEEEYENSGTHQPVTPGSSYPAEPDELIRFLDEAFAASGDTNTRNAEKVTNAKALYAPHIDPRVGMRSYVEAFTSIAHLRPKRLVIIATSHYSGFYPDTYQNKPFIISNKHFEMPLGTVEADREAIAQLLDHSKESGLTGKDRAHRIEHSIELPLLFLSYLWDHPYKIIPILVSSLDDLFYMPGGHKGQLVHNFSQLLRTHFAKDDDTFFLVSGDLAHIGKKFGDEHAATTMFEEVEKFDRQFLRHAEQGAGEKLLELMREQYDPYRTCGFPPLYTFLKSMPGIRGTTLHYDVWDEQERESAVSFGSILYGDTNKTE